MGVVNTVKSGIRFAVNTATRSLIKDEAVRKKLVEKHYAKAANRVNSNASYAGRTSEDLLDWRKTMGFRFRLSREVYRANGFYGIGETLRRFAGSDTCVKACIEHGVHFGNYVNKQELDGSGLPCLLTFSETRLGHIREVSNVPVGLIGPYIAYAEDYLDDKEFSLARERLGKTLLVFPSHSVDRVRVSYELDDLVSEIERVKANHDIETVLICLYYRDLLNGAAKDYERFGYRVVTAGYREDSLFLARQRSLISLADLTISNNVGTHVGYCAYLKRPHIVYVQEKLYESDSVLDNSEFDNAYAEQLAAEKTEVAEAFRSYSNELTEEQKRVCEKYWGFSYVRSKKELFSLFSLLDQAYEAKSSFRQSELRKLLTTSSTSDRSLVE